MDLELPVIDPMDGNLAPAQPLMAKAAATITSCLDIARTFRVPLRPRGPSVHGTII
jgi:hypothetical protein